MFAFITYMAVLYPSNLLGRVWLTVLLVLCWSAVLRLIKIRGYWDEALAIGVAIAVVWFPTELGNAGFPEFPLTILPGALAVGMLVHLAGDIVTKQGCPILWPFSKKRVAVKLFTTGKGFEKVVVTGLVIVGTSYSGYVWIIGMFP
jgi:hypothetical protein